VAGRQETIEVAATPEAIYDLVGAVDHVPEHSPECRRIEWISERRELAVGARLRARNRWRGLSWWREVHITAAERGRKFPFETVPGRGIYNDTTRWRYDFESTPAGTRSPRATTSPPRPGSAGWTPSSAGPAHSLAA
jgi:hypothetical protein